MLGEFRVLTVCSERRKLFLESGLKLTRCLSDTYVGAVRIAVTEPNTVRL